MHPRSFLCEEAKIKQRAPLKKELCEIGEEAIWESRFTSFFEVGFVVRAGARDGPRSVNDLAEARDRKIKGFWKRIIVKERAESGCCRYFHRLRLHQLLSFIRFSFFFYPA